MKTAMTLSVVVVCWSVGAMGATAPATGGEKKVSEPEPLGSPKYMPSPERSIGWRGDGTGRYPAATPIIRWSRTKSAGGYDSKGIVWMTQLPNKGVSTPIIVGEKMFLTCEPTDLVCLEKTTGKVLWIRSNSEFEGLSEEERKENPVFAEKLAPLAEKLAKANDATVEVLNKQLGAPINKAFTPVGADKKKLEGQINTEQLAIDKKKYERYWGQEVFGFAGQTPVSDGTYVAAFFTTGITACYDLDGNRKWIHRGKGGGAEHGNFASPVLLGGKVVVWAHELRGYDVATGKLEFSIPARGNNNYGSMFRMKVGEDDVAGFQYGYFVRVRDGKPLWEQGMFGDCVATPIVEDGLLYATMGYPKQGVNEANGFRAFKIPASTEPAPSETDDKPGEKPEPAPRGGQRGGQRRAQDNANKLSEAFIIKTEWAADEVPVDKKSAPFNRGFTASPLIVDGLIYRMSEGGGLIVNDARDGSIVYRKVLPMRPKTQYWNWAGASTSPTLGGKHIFLMDNQGTTVVLEPGKEYKEVAVNKLDESLEGREQSQNLATPIFEGSRMYYRTPGYLYCIGEK